VKTALFLPLLFLLVTVVVALVLLAVLLAMGWTVSTVPNVVAPVLLVATIIATILVLLTRLRWVTAPMVTYFTMVFVLTAAIGGVLFLAPSPTTVVDGVRVNGARGIEARTIYQGPRFSVVVQRSVGSDLRELVVVDHRMAAEIPRIQRDRAAYLDSRDGVITRPGRPDISVAELEGFGPPTFPGMVVRAAGDAVASVVELRRSALRELPLPLAVPGSLSRGVSAALSLLVLALAISAIWTPMRVTRWPLLNLVTSVAYGRLIVAIPRLSGSLMEWEPVAGWVPTALREEAPMLLWLVLAMVMILVSVLLPSLADWRHHMHYGEPAR
jgi:hypothetical protein